MTTIRTATCPDCDGTGLVFGGHAAATEWSPCEAFDAPCGTCDATGEVLADCQVCGQPEDADHEACEP